MGLFDDLSSLAAHGADHNLVMPMSHDLSAANAHVLRQEIDWFRLVRDRRFAVHTGEMSDLAVADALEAPPDLPTHGAYADLVRRHGLTPAERLVLILALIPEVRPKSLDLFLLHNQSIGRRFTEFGGIVGHNHGGLIPTVETALFLLAGDGLAARLHHRRLFEPDRPLLAADLVALDHRQPGEPAQAAVLRVSARHLDRILTGLDRDPPPSPDFPAQRLTTPLDWSDLVLDSATLTAIEDIRAWIRHHETMMQDWGLGRRLKPGYRSLFYGPPGTGKTLTASLLGKATGMPVYRVDLSMVVSKWIGETEKNLARLFDQAQQQHWVLFFDEADALFGKRTETRSSNDRSANQQVAYLLQRIEEYPGIVILATNLRGNLDEAFLRRFQSVIYFRMPGVQERLRLWREMFVGQPFALAADIDLPAIAGEFEMSAGSILNVLRHACLQAVRRTPQQVQRQDVYDGIRAERLKENRSNS